MKQSTRQENDMTDFLLEHYLWLKAFHVIAVISWLAGMLYLPRLFAYHADSKPGSDKSETFKIMERRLLRIIMNPAMIAVWAFGGMMIWANSILLAEGWMHVKLTCIVAMTMIHHLYVRWFKVFLRDGNEKPAKFYKIWNEVPTLLMVIIVFMVVTKPF